MGLPPVELDVPSTFEGVIHSSWLTKVKGDGARAKWLQSSGRRYFTIDFESQYVFYAHSPTDKRVSLPILFRDILVASMVDSANGPPEKDSGHCWQPAHNAGYIMRHRPTVGEFAFILQTRERMIRLAADSESEAYRWVVMLNAAQCAGQGVGQGEANMTIDRLSPRDALLEFENQQAPRHGQENERQQSPRPGSRSTTPGSESLGSEDSSIPLSEPIRVSSPTAWLDPPTSSTVLTSSLPWLAAPPALAAKGSSTRLPLTPTGATVDTATTSTSLTASGLLKLQAADFGFDDGSDREGGCAARSRESSPDSVTISPLPRPGPPNVFLGNAMDEMYSGCASKQVHPLSEKMLDYQSVFLGNATDEMHSGLAPRQEQPSSERVLDHKTPDDDDSDCEIVCEAPDRREEQDLDLRKTQQPAVEHGEPQDAARIAWDLGLLQKSGGARSATSARVNAAPAPLRQRNLDQVEVATPIDEDEDKARRKAERRAVKAMKPRSLQMSQEPLPEENSEEEAKAIRRAARKAAKEAGRQPPAEAASEGPFDDCRDDARIAADLALIKNPLRATCH